jgi:molybdenum cofactor cytidylyltransferase
MNAAADGPVVVVLAGGPGLRFRGDGHKLAQRFGSSTVLGSTLSQVVAAGLPLVVVTTSALVPLAQQVVAARDIVLVPPVDSPTREPVGVGYSIAAGVSARAQARGWLLLPGDMPLIRPETLRAVREGLRHSAVVYAQHQGRRGHPVGFSQELFTELSALSGDEGARRLLARYPGLGIEVDDLGLHHNIDTEATLAAAREHLAATLALIGASADAPPAF